MVLVDAREPRIPLTARPDGETKRGTVDAKDERRRSDVQNMVATGSEVRSNVQFMEGCREE
jgi:hypothetical protein